VDLLSIRENKFQGATIIRVESEIEDVVVAVSNFSYTKCAGLLQRSVTLYLPGIPLNGAILGKRNLCRTRRTTRHVATVPCTMADLFVVHEGSPRVGSLGERATNKVDLPANWAKFDEMFLSFFIYLFLYRACNRRI